MTPIAFGFFSNGHSTGIYSWDYPFWLGSNRDAVWREYLHRLAMTHAPMAIRQSEPVIDSSLPGYQWQHPDPAVDPLRRELQALVARSEQLGLPRREVSDVDPRSRSLHLPAGRLVVVRAVHFRHGEDAAGSGSAPALVHGCCASSSSRAIYDGP